MTRLGAGGGGTHTHRNFQANVDTQLLVEAAPQLGAQPQQLPEHELSDLSAVDERLGETGRR
jgi:hypothetical protein